MVIIVIIAFFAENDELVHGKDEFKEHYHNRISIRRKKKTRLVSAYDIPGGHRLEPEILIEHIVPYIQFYLGLANHIKIVKGKELQDYAREYIDGLNI